MRGVRSTNGGEERFTQGFGEESVGKRSLGRCRCGLQNKIKMMLQKMRWEHGLDWSGSE